MPKIFWKLFFAASPILLMLAIYFYTDPFKVLYHYDSYYPRDGIQAVTLNKDYISTQTLINHYPAYHYDSYIFGSSRSMFYRVADWEQHIHATHCYHFDGSDESIYGIEKKFEFLHNRGIPIKNALIILDLSVYTYWATENDVGAHLFVKHPALSGQSRYRFQLSFFKAFCSKEFLFNYVRVLFTHHITQQMIDNWIFNKTNVHYEVATNEVSYRDYDTLIARDPDAFYRPRMKVFYKRDTIQNYAPQTLVDAQKKMFLKMKKIMDEDGTNYRVIINPLYDQLKIDSVDLAALKNIFGEGNVFDFSGINDITNDYHNYYENSHYRPVIAAAIMDSIYAGTSGK